MYDFCYILLLVLCRTFDIDLRKMHLLASVGKIVLLLLSRHAGRKVLESIQLPDCLLLFSKYHLKKSRPRSEVVSKQHLAAKIAPERGVLIDLSSVEITHPMRIQVA